MIGTGISIFIFGISAGMFIGLIGMELIEREYDKEIRRKEK